MSSIYLKVKALVPAAVPMGNFVVGVDMQQALAAMVGYGIITVEESAKLQRGESLN